MKDCAKRLGINYSTAKHILKVYRRTGSIETDLMKKRKEKNMKLQQKLSKQAEINPLTRPVIANSKYSGFTPFKRNTPNVELTTLQPGECSPASTDYTSAWSTVDLLGKLLSFCRERILYTMSIFISQLLKLSCWSLIDHGVHSSGETIHHLEQLYLTLPFIGYLRNFNMEEFSMPPLNSQPYFESFCPRYVETGLPRPDAARELFNWEKVCNILANAVLYNSTH